MSVHTLSSLTGSGPAFPQTTWAGLRGGRVPLDCDGPVGGVALQPDRTGAGRPSPRREACPRRRAAGGTGRSLLGPSPTLGPGHWPPSPTLSPTEHKDVHSTAAPGAWPGHACITRAEGHLPPSPRPRATHQAPDQGPPTKSLTKGHPLSPRPRPPAKPPNQAAWHQAPDWSPGTLERRCQAPGLRASGPGLWRGVARILTVGFPKEVVPFSPLLSSRLAWPVLSCRRALLVPAASSQFQPW